MNRLKELILSGFPNSKCNLPADLRPFWNVRDLLTADEEIILLGSRVVIPRAMHQRIVQDLLDMHQGATKMRQRARLSVFWPGMDNEIANAAGSCNQCMEGLRSQAKEPLRPRAQASRPF